MEKLILSVDPGKFLTKAVGLNTSENALEGTRESFRSKLYDLNDGYIEPAGESYAVEYEGSNLIIGEQGTTDGVEETNKATPLHKICVYTAITRYIKPDELTDVYMVLSCPLNLLKSAAYKNEYKRFIMNDGDEIEIKVNDKNYLFVIRDITIKAEGSGILYLNKDRFLNCEVGIIDIGGLNMQFCRYINGVPQPESRITEMTGSNKLIQDLREDLEIFLKGKPVTFEQSAEALKDKVLRINNADIDDTREIVKNRIHQYLRNDVIRNLTRKRISLELLQPIVVGGTCINIREELKEEIPNADIQEDPQWASVEGLSKIAYAKYKDL